MKILRLLPVVLALALPAHAQTFPAADKVFHVVVGFPAGSGADILVRYFADKLGAVSGQKTVVENKPGAMSVLAAEAVARSKPDGYTILASGSPLAQNVYLFKKLSYDPVKDFTSVATIAKLPFVLMVEAKSPYTSVRSLTDALKAKGAKASYAYASTSAQANAGLYKTRTNLQALGIAFKGTAEALPALKSGEIDFVFVDCLLAMQNSRSGLLRGLAVTSQARSSVLPEIPTMVEAGVADFDYSAWWGMLVPAGTPQPAVQKLEAWFEQIVAMEETKKFLADQGADPFPGNAKFMAEHLNKDIRNWGVLAKLAKIEPQWAMSRGMLNE